MMIKKIMSVLMLVMLLSYSAFAGGNFITHEIIHDNLDRWSKIKMSILTSNKLSVAGQERMCSSYPDDIRSNVYGHGSSRVLRELSFNPEKLSEYGLANIYVQPILFGGTFSFVAEREYSQSYVFLADIRYVIEYYNCPPPVAPAPTCSYQEFNQFICTGNNVYKKVRETNCDEAYTKFVKACIYGCSNGDCLPAPTPAPTPTPQPQEKNLVCYDCSAGGLMYRQSWTAISTCQLLNSNYYDTENQCRIAKPQLFSSEQTPIVGETPKQPNIVQKIWAWIRTLFGGSK